MKKLGNKLLFIAILALFGKSILLHAVDYRVDLQNYKKDAQYTLVQAVLTNLYNANYQFIKEHIIEDAACVNYSATILGSQYTMLSAAIISGSFEVVKLLIDNGASIDYDFNDGKNSFKSALEHIDYLISQDPCACNFAIQAYVQNKKILSICELDVLVSQHRPAGLSATTAYSVLKSAISYMCK